MLVVKIGAEWEPECVTVSSIEEARKVAAEAASDYVRLFRANGEFIGFL